MRYLPIADWLPRYRREDLFGDLLAGLVVAIMLVPQGMAYALLAGLPPEVGLYASLLPLALYALFGTSRTLAVGPVAMISLLVASGVGELAEPGSARYVALAVTLAALVGALQLAMGLVRMGFLTSLLSHPVLSGFTSGAALIIAFSQARHLLGVDVTRSPHFGATLVELGRALPETHAATAAVGGLAVAVLLAWPRAAAALAARAPVPRALGDALAKAGPLVAVAVGIGATAAFGLAGAGVGVVGAIPRGLPRPAWPDLDAGDLRALLPTAVLIALVSFMESIAVARSLASRRREKVDADQELVALGAANLGAALTGAYPVTGGFSRSVVNFGAGAHTGLASLVTAGLVALTVAFLTPALRDLPNAVLAAIVVVAVARLVDVRALVATWRYSRGEGAALAATFLAVLALGIEIGILVGAATALASHVARAYWPHVAVLGRVPGTEHYRNVARHAVETCADVLAVRVDENLWFLNAGGLEDRLTGLVAESPGARALVLVCSGINWIDSSALDAIEDLATSLGEAGVDLHLAEVKGPVMDRLERAGFPERLGRDRIHLSTHGAIALAARGRAERDAGP